jgi:hypothetical protein
MHYENDLEEANKKLAVKSDKSDEKQKIIEVRMHDEMKKNSELK